MKTAKRYYTIYSRKGTLVKDWDGVPYVCTRRSDLMWVAMDGESVSEVEMRVIPTPQPVKRNRALTTGKFWVLLDSAHEPKTCGGYTLTRGGFSRIFLSRTASDFLTEAQYGDQIVEAFIQPKRGGFRKVVVVKS